MSGRVVVVGSVNVDLVMAVATLPAAGETVTGGRFARHHGGKGGNQAVAAARLGAPTWLLAAVGADAFGEEALAALAVDGVRTDAVVSVPGAATGVATILVAADGENLIAVASGANSLLDADGVRAALGELVLQPADVVVVGHEIPTATARTALATARRSRATTILNPAPAGGIDRSVFGLADVVTPNRHELALLVGAEWARTGRQGGPPADPAVAAATLLERNAEGDGAGAVLVTMGAAGALLVERRGTESIDAPRVETVDAVGAGDALSGALSAALAAGRPLGQAAREAVVAASLSTTRAGAREGMPDRQALDLALAP